MYVARVHIRNHPLEFRGRAARGVATAAVVAGALAILAPTAAAQQTIRGRLEASDQVYAGGRVQDSYPVRVRAGTRLTVRTVATPPLMTAVMMQSPANGLELMEPEGNPRGETFEWIYTKDITRDETVTVLVVGMAPVGQRGGAGDYTLRIEAPGGGATPAPAPAPAGRGGGTRVAAPAARVLRAGVRVQGELAAS
ncbi:MAG TPA: hypothetical protein VE913_17815, partial [Longimicrobium sp.]|nr:hypothetical protein [Longimicrobium sp.]